MNLGNALERLGERESGTARLEQAVTAYRAALGIRTRETVPLDWAMTQMNLGKALERLGERESGTARLEEAVSAYRAALTERTRERAPLDWAITQMNLGAALETLPESARTGQGGSRRRSPPIAPHLKSTRAIRGRAPMGDDRVQHGTCAGRHGSANRKLGFAQTSRDLLSGGRVRFSNRQHSSACGNFSIV